MRPTAQAVVEQLLEAADVAIGGPHPWDMQVHDPQLFARVLRGGTLALGEGYIDGAWDCEELDTFFCRVLRAGVSEDPRFRRSRALVELAGWLANRQSRRRARHAIRRHYDLGQDLFAAMLDPLLQYSCAYYENGDTLAQAQERKLRLIARKLGLQPGLRVLDIGCGWGGLARYFCQHYGCEVVGITLSADQARYARTHVQGLAAEIRLQDYRELSGTFDRVVSVGMLEHVGWRNYREFFTVVHRTLAPGGLFLCHTIGGNASQRSTDPFIDRYIFPDSLLPSVAQVSRAAEVLFVLEDTHNFGANYDLTLCAWDRNIQAAWPQLSTRYDERFRRMWHYYLASCAGAFRARCLQLYQFVFSAGGVPGGYVGVR